MSEALRDLVVSLSLQIDNVTRNMRYNVKWLEVSQMRKSESAVKRCKTISTVQKLLGGKYKIELLWYIGKCDIRRFGQLRRQIGVNTESSLTKQLRELEDDELIRRYDFVEIPPRVEYAMMHRR